MKKISILTAAVSVTAVLFSCGGPAAEAEKHDGHEHAAATSDTAVISADQNVYFAGDLKDGAEVSSPLVIKFGVRGMEVQHIDSGINHNKGHHHLLIDTMSFIPAGQSVPVIDNRIIHFGKAQTESKPIALSKGKHRLALQFADGLHRSYGVKMSKAITVVVK